MMTHEEWIASRRHHLGASEVAAVLGVSPFAGPLSVYESKINGSSLKDNEWMKFGRDVEGAIANLYATRTGRHVDDLGATSIAYHPDIPWLGATLDRVTEETTEAPSPAGVGGTAPLELKHVGAVGARAGDWADDPPLHYQVQLQIQMACTDSLWGSLAGMFPGYDLRYVDIVRDDEFLEAAFPVLDTFWDRVKRKDPPPVDDQPGVLDVVKRLWQAETGEIVDLSTDLIDVADEWEAAKREAREAGKRAKVLEAKIRGEMKDATVGTLMDGTRLTLKTTTRKGYTKTFDDVSYRTLRRGKQK